MGYGKIFTPSPHEEIPSLFGQLERDLQAETTIDPLIWAFMIHCQLEAIHPFRDGNGRVGRLLLALMIYKACGFGMPWLYFNEYFEENRYEYFDAQNSVRFESDWARWIGFCLTATISVGTETIARIRRMLEIKQSYEERIKRHKTRDRLIHIVPRLLSCPIVRYADLMKDLKISYPTARADMEALVKMGIVAELGEAKSPKLFHATELYDCAHSADED